MRRIDIINSVLKIRNTFVDSGVYEIFNSYLSADKKNNNAEEIMSVFRNLSINFQNLDENDRKVLEIFELKDIESANVWSKLLGADQSIARDTAFKYYRSLSYMREFLPKTVELLKQDNVPYKTISEQAKIDTESLDSQDIISLILPEDNNKVSHPERLIKALNSINVLYNSIISLLETTGEIINNNKELTVIAIDSGSDKSFDFLGAAQAISALKDLIINLWDRVVFYKEKKMHERIDLITKALPVLENINNLEKENKIGREQAEILRRNIILGTNDFILAGGILPEFERHSTYNPRQLMSPEPKLLSSADVSEANEASSSRLNKNINSPQESKDSDELTPEEEEFLKKLTEKKKNKKSSD